MKKILFVVMAVLTLSLSSCIEEKRIDGMISWGTGFMTLEDFSTCMAFNQIYRDVFAQYGEVLGEPESTGSYCVMRALGTEKKIKDAFNNGIRKANEEIAKKFPSRKIYKEEPKDVRYISLHIDAKWDNWSASEDYYIY